MSSEPSYRRLQVDERRRQLLVAGAALFAEHAYEEISMREIAQAAGVSKPLLYHYFPSKIDLFKAAVAEKASELARAIEPRGTGSPLERLAESLDAYLAWIEANGGTWSKLMESAATLPEAGAIVEEFREQTLALVLVELIGKREPRPVLRIALRGWLGYLDAAILDWVRARDLPRETLRDLLLGAFSAALVAAHEADPEVTITAG